MTVPLEGPSCPCKASSDRDTAVSEASGGDEKSDAGQGSDMETVVSVEEVGRGGRRTGSRHCTTRPLEEDYRIERKVLGTGMNGAVRLATSRSDRQQFAVKSFRKRGLSAQSWEDLKNEAQIYLALDHPHVARLEMVYETAEELHFLMEHCAGGELYDRLAAKRRYSEPEAAQATRQMLLAVAYLHGIDIAHRDLKLQNFLYEAADGDQLKLIDFGIAKFTDRHTKMSQACGSLDYVAPEVLARSYTNKADLWSMGVIVHMLLTGHPPFYGREADIYRRIKAGTPQWSPRFYQLSTSAKEFLRSLLVKDTKLRLDAAAALGHWWLREQQAAGEAVALDARVVGSLQRFAQAPKFTKEVLILMSWSLPNKDCGQLRQQFLALDTENLGAVDVKAFKSVLAKSAQFDGEEAEALFRNLDIDASDRIEYSEFLAAAITGKKKLGESVLRKTFARFDFDGNGKVDESELHKVLGGNLTRSEVKEVLREADTSGDGELDYDEFRAFLQRSSAQNLKPAALERGDGATKRKFAQRLGRVLDLACSVGLGRLLRRCQS